MKEVDIGNESFADMINNDSYYVDKISFIKSVFKKGVGKVMLITRPRRFGKTLTMNTFIDYVYALRDKKYQKKGCFDKALNLAKEKISSWFTQQIEYVKNYILSIQNELINNANF